MRAEPTRYELHFQDETHLETNPYLCRVWHRRGTQPTLPGVGTNRRVTVFGSVEALGRARIELVRAAQDTAGFVRYLELLEAHQQAVQREIYLVVDNGSAHTSQLSLQALAARKAWLHVVWLAKYAPQLNPIEREWRRLKRDARSHLAPDLRAFVDAILVGLDHLGGAGRRSWTRCPTGFSTGTASRLRGAAPAVPWEPKTATSERPIAENRTYPQLLRAARCEIGARAARRFSFHRRPAHDAPYSGRCSRYRAPGE